MVQVLLPASLVRLFPGAPRQVEMDAASVAQAIAALDQRWPGMRDRICDSTPAIRRHLKVFVDGELANLTTPLRPGAELLVMTAMSGG
ncbi:MoaD/ThiS family protein [Falsiroseomonas tokyonensis]|uniref:MoaD/ThiS family protein n=1 Tax=Falsiroseomonas tokyonensis TaxID=430521 RepID=A0ABV7BWX9_9PROT|nr:MoaD/ThiS family protein [Falsiroseomonas tokyonensis]MBU8539512.1 MoaD/ThiS family protein [Falsiroseomonas tokyonensis]